MASLWLMPRVHGVYAGLAAGLDFGALTTVRFVIAMLVLLPPTILMGATLPVLIATVARRGIRWEVGATRLYATNTFGAVVGAGATGLALVPHLGARLSVVIAAATSAFAGLLVFAVWRGEGEERPEDEGPTPEEDAPSSVSKRRVRAVALLVAGAGFASLAGEVLWTRVLRMVVQGTTQAFAAMLVNFLTGIAIGSVVANRLARRHDARWLFGGTQLLLAALSFWTMWLGSQMPRLLVVLQGEARVIPHEWWVILVVSVVLLAPMAIVLGTSVPLAWRLVGGSPEEAARHGGTILAFNTIGGLVGSLAAGFLLIPALGIEASVVTLATVHAVLAATVFGAATRERSFAIRLGAIAGPLMLLALFFRLGPSLHVPYLLDAWSDPVRATVAGPAGEWRSGLRFLEEGRNTTVTVVERGQMLRLFNDGRPESGFGTGEPGFGQELVTLGALPSVYGSSPERAMVIGLGAGHSAAVVLGGEYERVDVVELESAIVRAARYLYEAVDKPFPLDDERARLVVDDARAQLVLAEPGSLDAVVSQPSHPWLAGSSALYTEEFFEEVEAALADEGVFSLWTNLFRIRPRQLRMIVATLLEVFPHVHAYVVESSSMLFAASKAPLAVDQGYGRALQLEGLEPFVDPFGLGALPAFASRIELDTAGARAFAADAPIIVDDRPTLEFELARLPENAAVSPADLDWLFHDIGWLAAETLATVPPDERLELLLTRIAWTENQRKQLARLERSLPAYELPAAEHAIVEGALAEAMGDVGGALRAYERGLPDPTAQRRLARLLGEERLFGRLVGLLELDGGGEAVLGPILQAALASRDREVARRVLEHPQASSIAAPLREVVRAWLTSCEAMREQLAASPVPDEHVALVALECASPGGDPAAIRASAERLQHLRRVRAAADARAGVAAASGNVGKALRHFRRALRANPAQATAAAGLARLLSRTGRREEAREVLRSARVATQGLPSATALLTDTAVQLQLWMPPETDGGSGGASATSLRPVADDEEPSPHE